MSLQFTEIVSAVNTFLPSAAYDVVAVYDENYRQVFTNARPIKAIVREEAKIMEHPLETGAVIADHIIYNPIEIELEMVLTPFLYRDTYQNIKQLFLAATKLNVQTKTATYYNQLITAMPHEETADVYDTVTLSLKLKEFQLVTSVSQTLPAPKNPANTSTVKRGAVQPTAATPKVEKSTSVAYEKVIKK